MIIPPATNIQKPCLPHPQLHAKILNLVAKRMQPSSSTFCLQKQACGSCVTASPAGSTKRNSLTATRAKEAKQPAHQTVCELSSQYKRQDRKGKVQPKKSRSGSKMQQSSLTRQLMIKQKNNLKLISKVTFLSIDHSKMGDFTIDLRPQMPTQFVNVKMMNKLRLENAEKERRISQLERQVLELHQRIIEMGLSLQKKGKQPFSDPDISQLSVKNTIPKGSEEWQSIGQLSLPSNSCLPQIQAQGQHENEYFSLLRMLKIQANQIEQTKMLSAKGRSYERSRQNSVF